MSGLLKAESKLVDRQQLCQSAAERNQPRLLTPTGRQRGTCTVGFRSFTRQKFPTKLGKTLINDHMNADETMQQYFLQYLCNVHHSCKLAINQRKKKSLISCRH